MNLGRKALAQPWKIELLEFLKSGQFQGLKPDVSQAELELLFGGAAYGAGEILGFVDDTLELVRLEGKVDSLRFKWMRHSETSRWIDAYGRIRKMNQVQCLKWLRRHHIPFELFIWNEEASAIHLFKGGLLHFDARGNLVMVGHFKSQIVFMSPPDRISQFNWKGRGTLSCAKRGIAC